MPRSRKNRRGRPPGKTGRPAEPPVIAKPRAGWLKPVLGSLLAVASLAAFLFIQFYPNDRGTFTPAISVSGRCTSDVNGFVTLTMKTPPLATATVGLIGIRPNDPMPSCARIRFQFPWLVAPDLTYLDNREEGPGLLAPHPAIPASAIVRFEPGLGGTVVEIDGTRLPRFTPNIEFAWRGILTKDFSTYFVNLPVSLSNPTTGGWRAPKSIKITAAVPSDYDVTVTRPSELPTRSSVGPTFIYADMNRGGEFYLEFAATARKNWGIAIQWIAAAVFATAVAFIFGTLGMR
jgi:hypothetical protein